MATPVYRMMANDWLKELWLGSGGLITVQDLLRYGDFPFADKLLKDIDDRQAQMQAGQIPKPIMGEQTARLIGADQQSVNLAESMLMGNKYNKT